MRTEVESTCADHPDRFECPDALVDYSSELREYGLIIHDGGSSIRGISYCPWCGAKLPESLRDEWFRAMDRLGIDPWSDEIPEAYRSDAWWSKRRS